MTKAVELTVREIHCADCEHRIEKGLGRLPGVLRARASRETGRVTVTVQGDATGEAEIRARLAEIGYEPLER